MGLTIYKLAHGMTYFFCNFLSSIFPQQILLEKEFDDFYEDQVHKAAGPVVFVSKTLGMLPAIWTEDENESECKSYFNLYTFVLFIG